MEFLTVLEEAQLVLRSDMDVVGETLTYLVCNYRS